MALDVLVIGAGTAGAASAYFLASRGLRVRLIDARPRDKVGARWVNGVERTLYRQVDLPDPPQDVVFHRGGRFIVADSLGGNRQVVDEPPTDETDMRALNRWLIELAEQAGVEFRFEERARIGAAAGGRREVVTEEETLYPMVALDSAGLSGRPSTANLDPVDVCSAYQGVYEVGDCGAAEDWIGQRTLESGDIFSRAGVEGGYSILNVSVNLESGRVAVLTGALHQAGRRSGARIARDFVEETSWIGERVFGGGGLIPLRPGDPVLVDDQLVRVGDAAGQVFPQHGSGVAQGIIAASLAANAISAGLQRGDTSVRGLWQYQTEWYRTRGAVNAQYHPLRYFSSGLSRAEMSRLFAVGGIHASAVHRALAQAPMRVEPAMAVELARNFPQLIPIAPRLARALALGWRLERHSRSVPRRAHRAEAEVWTHRFSELMRRARRLSRA